MEDITAGSDPNHIPEFQIHGSGNLKSDYENSPNMPTFILRLKKSKVCLMNKSEQTDG